MSTTRLPTIIDADAHVLEPNDVWSRVAEPLRERAPRPCPAAPLRWNEAGDAELLARMMAAAPQLRANSGGSGTSPRELCWRGEPVWEGIDDALWKRGSAKLIELHGEAALANFDAPRLAEALRERGVDRAHLFPTTGLWVLAIDEMEPELASALARTYNDWLAGYCTHDPQLLRGVGAISLHDPEAAADEVERLAGRGWTAVTIRPNPVRGRSLGDPAHERLFATCERLGVALAIHEGTHARLATAGADRFTTRFAKHACSHPLEQMMAFVALVESGTFERHPDLRVAFMEAGCSWLPYWLWRLDEIEYANLEWELGERVTMPPSEYFRRQCWIACEASEPLLEQVVDLVGADRLLYGSDYPHIDHDGAIDRDVATLIERLGRPTATKILADNPRRFYGPD